MTSSAFAGFSLADVLPETFTQSDDLYYRSYEMPAATLRHMYFERPLYRACNALTDVVLETLRGLSEGECFYRGVSDAPPSSDRLWSRVLDGQANGEAAAIGAVLDALRRYVPGDTPYHAEHFRQMDFCCKMKLVYLKEAFGERTFVFERALTVWKSAVAALVNLPVDNREVAARDERLQALRDAYREINERIVTFLLEFERDRRHPSSAAPTRGDVEKVCAAAESSEAKIDLALARQDAVRLAVNRLDARDKRGRRADRLRFPESLQDYAASVWERAQHTPEVKQLAANGCRLRREHAYRYYSRDLIAAGIPDAKTFVAILDARSDRLYRASLKRLAAQKNHSPQVTGRGEV